MKRKVLMPVFAIALMAAGLFAYQSQKTSATDLLMANVEALSQQEQDQWYSGYTTGSVEISGRWILCCVRSSSSNACNYGVMG